MSDEGATALAAVLAHLDRLGAEYEAVDCDPTLADTATFCAHYGWPTSASANAILVKSKRGEPRHGLVMVLATHKVNNRAIRKLLETSKASFAPSEETQALTGQVIGGVTPFGMRTELPIWIDAAVMEQPWVIVGAGSRTKKIKLPPSVLAALPGAVVVPELAASIEVG